MDHFFKNSLTDKCTLGSDKSLINRRNVVTIVKKRVTAVRRFLDIEFKARIIAAALEVLEIPDINATPRIDILDLSKNRTSHEKKK